MLGPSLAMLKLLNMSLTRISKMVALTMKLTSADFAIHNIQAGSVLLFGLLESKNSKHERLRLFLGGAGDCCHVWLWVRISARTSPFL